MFSHSKAQQLQASKAQCKVTEEELAQGRRSLLRDHERGVGRNGEEADFTGIARGMLQKSSGGSTPASAFTNSGVYIADVRQMAEDVKEEAEEAQRAKAAARKASKEERRDDVPQETEVEASAEKGQGSTAKRRRFFDESIVHRKKRDQEQAMQKLSRSMQECVESAEAAIAAAGDGQFLVEVSTCTHRLNFLRACLQQDGQEPGTSAQAALDALRASLATGGRPPCDGWEQLSPVKALDTEQENTFQRLQQEAKSNEDVMREVARLTDARRPLAALVKSVQKATQEITGALKSKKRVEEQQAKAALGGGKTLQTRGRPSTGIQIVNKKPIYEHAPACGKEIEAYSGAVAAEPNLQAPFAISKFEGKQTLQARPAS